jgi:hypothetical protein
MNNKYLLLLLFSILGFGGYAQQGPATPFVTVVPGAAICAPGDCTDLTALYFNTGATSSYEVTSIDYNPPYSFTGGTVVDATQDDFWSSAIHLIKDGDEMDFCFYGEKYNYLMINSNGAVTFSVKDIVPGGQYEAGQPIGWNLTGTPIPTAAGGGGVTNVSIFGVLQDTNPNPGAGNPIDQSINYGVFGVAPNRVFILNVYKTVHFSCGAPLTYTSQMVLYETTNVIEVFVKDRPNPSCGWNSGRAVIGIQKDATTGLAAPGMMGGVLSIQDLL